MPGIGGRPRPARCDGFVTDLRRWREHTTIGNMKDRPYPLSVAVELFLGKPWSVSSLRTEIRKGRLVPMRIAGRYAVTEAAIAEMMVRCREENDHGSTCDRPAPTSARQPGSSSTPQTVDTSAAQAAARATLKALSAHLPPTSQKSTKRRRPPDNLIRLPLPTR